MLAALAENWWVFLVRGILAMLFALAAFAWPGLTLVILLVAFGVYCLADGGASIIMGLKSDEKLWPIVGGLVSVAAGLIVLMRPGLGALALLLMIGIWAVAHGVADVVLAIRIRKEIKGEWALALAGIVQIAFGIMVIKRPGSGALAMVTLIGIFVLMTGILLIATSFRLRRVGRELAGGA